MKTCTVNFHRSAFDKGLIWTGLSVIVLFTLLSCDKERNKETGGVCGTITDCSPVSFTNQAGHMIYVAEAEQWAISFVPDCLATGNIDTKYIGLISDFPLDEELKVQNKAVLFSGEIKPYSGDQGMMGFPAGVELYELHITELKSAQN